MVNETVEYGLVAALLLLLILAMFSDLRHRIIENWLTLTIACLAPLYWVTSGMPIWPDMAVQFGIGFGTFLFFMIFFALGQFGGGDLKLLGALALWLPFLALINALFVMAIVGGALTVITFAVHKITKKEGAVQTPYGIAISIAGIFAMYERYINHFA